MKPVLVTPSGLSQHDQHFSRVGRRSDVKMLETCCSPGSIGPSWKDLWARCPSSLIRMDASLPPSWYHSTWMQCGCLPAPHSHPSLLSPPLPKNPHAPSKLMPSRSSHPILFPVAINTDSPTHSLSLLRHLSAQSLFPAPALS